MIDVFLHIPKTGGTSLHRALRFIYVGQKIYTSPPEIRSPEAIAERMEEEPNVKLVRGHVDYGLHNYLSEPCRYFTMLRHPVRRVVSLFYDVKHWRNDAEVASMTLAEYIESEHHTYVRNDQVKRIAGDGTKHPGADDELLQRAKDNLSRRIAAFGLTERYDESLILLQRSMGWNRYPLYIRGKSNKRRPSISSIDPNTIRTIRRQNELDIRLYEFARSRFEDSIQAMGDIASALRRFQRINSIYDTVGKPLLQIYSQIRQAR